MLVHDSEGIEPLQAGLLALEVSCVLLAHSDGERPTKDGGEAWDRGVALARLRFGEIQLIDRHTEFSFEAGGPSIFVARSASDEFLVMVAYRPAGLEREIERSGGSAFGEILDFRQLVVSGDGTVVWDEATAVARVLSIPLPDQK
jgi:hypothetical protein